MLETSRLRGINLGGWYSQIDAIAEKDPETFPGIDSHIHSFIREEDFTYIENSGFNHIRLPIDYQIFFHENGSVKYPERLDALEATIQKFLKKNLIVMLDLHECPGHDFHNGHLNIQRFFTDKDQQDATFKIWSHLTERFSHEKNVCFEILNEPVAENNQIWDKVKNELVKPIRAIAPESTIIVGSNNWSNPQSFSDLTPVPEDDNIIYNCHFYNPLMFTHQFANWIDNPETHKHREYPGIYDFDIEPFGHLHRDDFGEWNRERLKQTLKPVLEWREKYQRPVICNEFGVYHQAPRDSQLRFLKDLIEILENVGIGWTYWTYKNLDFGIVSDGERLHADLERFQNPERRDHELVRFLTSL